MTMKQAIVTGLSAAGLVLAGGLSWAAGQYGPGASDTEIKIGNTVPYSGPASAYGTIGKSEAAYFAMINDQGGINGRKVNFLRAEHHLTTVGLRPPSVSLPRPARNRFASGPRDRRKQGPIQFLENNPIQSSFWVRFMCPKTRRNWLRLPIVRFHPGSSCPQAAALRRSHTRGRRPPPFSARSRVSWHTVNLRSAPSSAIIRTSEHFHVFSPPPRLSVRMFGSGGKKRANASSNSAAL